MAKLPKVSVIVPVYNVERYLGQCMDRLCGQTLRDIEIICVNDGSTDGSLKMLGRYAAADSRVMVIDKPNSGYGASMNRGIAEASGEYIGICEPDDYSSPVMFEKLYRAAKKTGADLAKCNYFEHYDGRDHPVFNLGKSHPYGRGFDPAARPSIIKTRPAIWTGLYRREMLEKRDVGFRETPGASFQDTGFVKKAWFAAEKCVLVLRPLHHYRCDNPNSSVKTTDKVFAVADEMRSAEEYLRTKCSESRRRAFIPWFHSEKWRAYEWNYERVDAEGKEAFCEAVRAEYAQAMQAGELQQHCFGEEDWEALEKLLEGVAGFLAAYPERY